MSVDTLAIARNLRAADLPQPQAEAIAAAIGSSILETAATKADLLQLRTELKADIETKVEQLKSTMMTWFIGTTLTLGALMIALIKL